MKKLMMAAMIAGSMFAMAAEEAPAAAAATPAAVQTMKKAPARAKLTPEQIAERKAKREKFFADRKAKIEAQILEVLKKHGVEGETAQAIVKDLAETMSNPFMGMGARARKPRPAKVEKPATK